MSSGGSLELSGLTNRVVIAENDINDCQGRVDTLEAGSGGTDLTAEKKQESDSDTVRYALVYPVSVGGEPGNISEVYRFGRGIHVPDVNDVLTSEIGSVSITVLAIDNNGPLPTPSWYTSDDMLIYPLSVDEPLYNTTVTVKRTRGALDTTAAYDGISESTPIRINPLGLIVENRYIPRSAGIPIHSITSYNSRRYLTIDPNYLSLIDGVAGSATAIITSIDGTPVYKDTTLPAMRSKPYVQGETVKVGITVVSTTPVSTVEVDLPVIPAREAISWI